MAFERRHVASVVNRRNGANRGPLKEMRQCTGREGPVRWMHQDQQALLRRRVQRQRRQGAEQHDVDATRDQVDLQAPDPAQAPWRSLMPLQGMPILSVLSMG